MLGPLEIILIIAIACVLFGPVLFKKVGKQIKETGEAAKKGFENGAKEAGVDVDLNNINKDTILNKVESVQNRVDKMLSDSDEDESSTSA